jgi:polysaccharide chain length determinant protein (PEP-CTERM system associated)
MTSAQQQNTPKPASIGAYLALVVRRRWLVGSFALVIWALASAASLVIPAKYRSETTILIEQPKVQAQIVPPAVTTDLQQQLQSLTEQILSRTRLSQIMDSFHLYGKQPDQPASEAMIQRMQKDITIDLVTTPGHSDQLSAFKVSYSAGNPQLAQEVAGQITSLFIAENLKNQQQLAEDTTSFLDSQLADARADLERQEKSLGEFRSKNLGELPEQMQGNVQILGGLQSRLDAATEALNTAEQQKLYLSSLVTQSTAAGNKGDSGVPASPAATSLDQQINKLKSDLATLSTRYTPQHPDVQRVKAQIASLERLRQQTEKDVASGKQDSGALSTTPSTAISPVAQLESQQKANELEIANRKKEITSLENQIEQYQGRLNLTPIREQQLADVARNYDQSKANYESLLEKKLQSQMATELAKREQGEQFRIIDPPNLPQKPYWPNRLLFSAGGLLTGLVLGFAIAFLIETAEARIYREQDLQDLATLPVLVTIPSLQTASEVQAASVRRRWEYVAATVMLLVVPVVTAFIGLKR